MNFMKCFNDELKEEWMNWLLFGEFYKCWYSIFTPKLMILWLLN